MKFLLILIVGLFWGRPLYGAEEESWKILLEQIPQNYIQQISTEEVAIRILKSFDVLDKNLRVANDNNKISLYYNGKLQKSLYKPQDINNIKKWVEICGEILNVAMKKSSIAAQKDFRAVDLILTKAVNKFDADSKYYPGITDEGRIKHRQDFAARTNNEILYIKIVIFNQYTKENLLKYIKGRENLQGIIMDLRASPGGDLAAAIEVADLFMDEGIIVSVKDKANKQTIYYTAKEGDITNELPLVVLIDGETASAAEVLAAALQEQSRAKIVGTSSFGKGTVQNLIFLPNGGVFSLSTAYYNTPSGKKISGKGVIPDVCTFEMPESKDIERLINSEYDANCGKELRVDGFLEEKIAQKLLK